MHRNRIAERDARLGRGIGSSSRRKNQAAVALVAGLILSACGIGSGSPAHSVDQPTLVNAQLQDWRDLIEVKRGLPGPRQTTQPNPSRLSDWRDIQDAKRGHSN